MEKWIFEEDKRETKAVEEFLGLGQFEVEWKLEIEFDSLTEKTNFMIWGKMQEG